MPVTHARHGTRSLGVALLVLLVSAGLLAGPASAKRLEFEDITPEQAGWSAEALDEAGEYAGEAGYAAVVLVHGGDVFYEWGNVTKPYKLHSVRKPMLSALYGIHVARGEIDLDATLAELGIDDSVPPGLTEVEKTATVRTLLQGRSAVYHRAAAEDQSMRDSRPERGSHEPGEFFYYNNWGFNAAGTIFRQETGLDIFEAFAEEIAEPIGMEDFDPDKCFYHFQRDISEHPAYHFRMSARDLARFGVLYWRGGEWQRQRVIPAAWVEESTSFPPMLPADSPFGYGYLWAVIPEGSPAAGGLGPRWYGHAGAGGHFLAVYPELELVLVLRVDTDDGGVVADEKAVALLKMIMDARVEESAKE